MTRLSTGNEESVCKAYWLSAFEVGVSGVRVRG